MSQNSLLCNQPSLSNFADGIQPFRNGAIQLRSAQNWQWPLHSGKAFGWIGRVLVFLCGLACPVIYM
ncbi:MAG: PepSY domain-containing protein [Nitrosomonas sp.]|nr:PepSY domain-containing protein [Nitrosomonas sp.]